jgi:hypothetical protein
MVTRPPRRTYRTRFASSHSHFGTHPSVIPDKIAPFFSCTYVEPILQPLCFQIHPWNGGVHPSNKKRNNSPCLYLNGKRCSLPGLPTHSGFCLGHSQAIAPIAVPVPVQSDLEDLSAALLPELSEFNSGVDIRKFLARLLVLVTKGRVSTRRAAVLAYISKQLLHSRRASPGDFPARQC